MHVFLCVRLDGFYVRAAREQNPALANGPLVVHEKGTVVDADRSAQSRGAVPGMPCRHARALLQDARFEALERDRFSAAATAWLDLLVPFSSAIEPLDQHMAAIDLSGHPRPDQIAALAVAALRRHHPDVKAGLGRAKWTAMLALVHGGEAVADPAAFVAGLSVEALIPASPRARAKLAELGYYMVGQAQAVPYTVLARQFGKEAFVLHQAIHGSLGDRVEASYPPHAAHGYLPFPGGTSSLEDLGLGIARLADEVGARLAASERETTDLHLHVEHEERTQTLFRTFAKPIRDARSLRCALALLTDGQIAEEVYGLRVTLPNLAACGRSQSSLYSCRSDDRSRLDGEMRRLRAVFGERAVIAGADVALPRRKLVLREFGGLVGWR